MWLAKHLWPIRDLLNSNFISIARFKWGVTSIFEQSDKEKIAQMVLIFSNGNKIKMDWKDEDNQHNSMIIIIRYD